MTDIEAYDLLATAVLLLDDHGFVVHANSSAEEFFGLSRKHLLGLEGRTLFQVDEALAARFFDAVNGKFGVLRQNLSVRRLGTVALASLTIVPLDHQPWAALLEIRTLLDRTQKLSKELKVQRESLRNLAHEVKNPLGGLRGAAQLLESELNSASLREYTSVIIAEADRLSALIDRLIAPQGETLKTSHFNIHEVCERVYKLVHAEFGPQIEISRDYDASVPELSGDFSRLVQALLNIVRNAAQALAEQSKTSPDHAALHGKLILRTRIGRQLALAMRPVRMGVIVSVIDNGPGVPDELHEKIFHPLVTGRANGTGLGLSLAQEFVQQHGGAVEFDSHPGHTEFRLILPLESP
ncbi:MAG: PAS domain-containing protein [Burkholderiaceae bacterium]|nr:PAS domain-containing protein [Burkholderiaceae bacterium]